MIEHTPNTTPATESQHPRTNEGACESEVETITVEALEREGWKTHKYLLNIRERGGWDGSIYMTVTFREDGPVVGIGAHDAPNCKSMRDVRTRVRLFTTEAK